MNRRRALCHLTCLFAAGILPALSLSGCDQIPSGLQKPQQADAPPRNFFDPVAEVPPVDILKNFEGRPLNALDYGLIRLNAELAPDLEKMFKAEHLFDAQGGIPKSVADVGYVRFSVGAFAFDNSLMPHVISLTISFPEVYIDGSKATNKTAVDRMKRALTEARHYFGAPCNPIERDGEAVTNYCQNYLYDYFQLPTDPYRGTDFASRAALLRKIYIDVTTPINQNNRISVVQCKGPLIEDALECK